MEKLSNQHSKIPFIASLNEFQTNHRLSIHLNWSNAKEWIQTLVVNIISSIHDDVKQRYTMSLENGIAAHNGPLEGFHLHHLFSHIRPLWPHSRENIPKGSTSIYTLLQWEHAFSALRTPNKFQKFNQKNPNQIHPKYKLKDGKSTFYLLVFLDNFVLNSE